MLNLNTNDDAIIDYSIFKNFHHALITLGNPILTSIQKENIIVLFINNIELY
jgi:hypothetical protein